MEWQNTGRVFVGDHVLPGLQEEAARQSANLLNIKSQVDNLPMLAKCCR